VDNVIGALLLNAFGNFMDKETGCYYRMENHIGESLSLLIIYQ